MRLFVGIPFPHHVSEQVDAVLAPLRMAFRGIAWVPPENIHITLKFLGEVEGDRLAVVMDALRGAAFPPPFDLRVSGGGAFPDIRNPKVLFLSAADSLELVGPLHQNIETALSAAGFPRETRPFHPHATVARIRGAVPKRFPGAFEAALSGIGFGTVPVRAVRLFESVLRASGAVYSVVDDFPLEFSTG